MKINQIASFAILLVIGIIGSCSTPKKSSMSNMVARMEVKEPINGVCDNGNVIAILPLPGNGQIKAVAPKTDEQITAELNSKVSFLKDKPDYEDKGMVNLIINCNGEMVKCEIDNKTKSSELDNQIVAIFAEMKIWTPGKINSKSVDTVELYSFTIKNGKIILS
jgi:hypothetical protein